PLQFVRVQTTDADREVVGLIASSLAYGNVKQIKKSIARVVDVLGPSPAAEIARLEPHEALRRLGGFKHRSPTSCGARLSSAMAASTAGARRYRRARECGSSSRHRSRGAPASGSTS